MIVARRVVVTAVVCCSINPITGRWELERPDPMAEMSDEQKEYEAMKLVNKLDKLQR